MPTDIIREVTGDLTVSINASGESISCTRSVERSESPIVVHKSVSYVGATNEITHDLTSGINAVG